MSKPLPTSALALASLLGACDPIITSVVELSSHDARVREDARTMPRPDAPGDKDSTAVEPEPAEPDGCMVLLDQTIPEIVTDAAVVASRFVQARTATAAGCVDADAGPVLLNASVFSRRDGLPMVERGQRYSYRWMSDTAMNRVRLQGGDEACAEQTVVNFDHGALQLAPSGIASCYEFTSPIEARYLRTTAADYLSPLPWVNLGAKPTKLRLCPAECPPGTEHDFTTDGGVDAAIP